MKNILNKRQEKEYQQQLRTASVVRESYLLQCKGKRLTPEKLYCLCKLTWWDGDKRAPLITLWEEKEQMIPRTIFEKTSKIGITNYYKPFRNSSFRWIQKNFKQLSYLTHSAAKMNSNSEAFRIAELIEKLPGIPRKDDKKVKLPPTSLLTPLFACLDPRKRFPMINRATPVKNLHVKLGIYGASLPDKVDTLIRLIRQYAIKDSFMLDVKSNDLSQIVEKNRTKRVKVKPKQKLKLLGKKDDTDLEVLLRSYTKEFIRKHNSMTNNLLEICKNCQCVILEGTGSNKFDALIVDYDGKGKDLLVEAKSSILRPHLRLAVGQLLDYRRGLPRRAATDLAILLPKKPDTKSLEFLNDVGIEVLWYTDLKLKRLSGNIKTRFSRLI